MFCMTLIISNYFNVIYNLCLQLTLKYMYLSMSVYVVLHILSLFLVLYATVESIRGAMIN